MKTTVISIGISLIFFSCQPSAKETSEAEEQLRAEIKNLEQKSADKDSSISSFIRSLNEIEENLNVIKEKEKIITFQTNPSIELSEDRKEMIIEDIKMINSLMEENRNKLGRMQHLLKKSNLKIGELEKMIDRLTQQLQEKDAEILALKDELDRVNIMLANLYTAYNERLVEMEVQEDVLNTAWFVFGTFKELKEKEVVTKEGGFVGLGGIKKLKQDFNKDYFTQINITETQEIDLFSKNARVITNHPAGSYEVIGEGQADKLIIKNPSEFWSVSKYLVIVVE